ncbi:glycosyltransferase family 4 protein [Paenibacillus sp. sgz500958]|uniref:glycosyltransferase family 4 protein n=1 Tax=Paenibacillus sp. sgz500958 TaxID=3242475 RepID=UPI0036D348C7
MAKIMFLVPYSKYYVNFLEDQLRSLKAEGHELIAVAPDYPSGKELKALGITFKRTPMTNTGINPFDDIVSLYKLVALLRQEKPDVLCCYSIKPNLYGSLAAKYTKIGKVYLFVTGLGYMFTATSLKRSLLYPFVKRLYSFAIKHCSRVFFENPDDRELFGNLGMPLKDKAILLNGLGVNLRKFRPRNSSIRKPVFLLVARLLKDKGIMEFAQAAKILKGKYPEAVFQLLGPFDRNPSAIAKETVMEWVSKGYIEYLGETKDVRPYLHRAKAFVLPSYYREGIPKSILEAMAVGLPIITTDWPGCRETVEHGVNGLLVIPGNSAALAEAMEPFIYDRLLGNRMGLMSRKIAVDRFDVNQVNAVIKEAMGLPPVSRPMYEQTKAGHR